MGGRQERQLSLFGRSRIDLLRRRQRAVQIRAGLAAALQERDRGREPLHAWLVPFLRGEVRVAPAPGKKGNGNGSGNGGGNGDGIEVAEPSEVDVVIAGLSAEDTADMFARLAGQLDDEIDLVRLEDLGPDSQQRVLAEGELILERP